MPIGEEKWQSSFPEGSITGTLASARRSTEGTPRKGGQPTPRSSDRTPRKGRMMPTSPQNSSFRSIRAALDANAHETDIADEADLDFWGKLWRSAGYVTTVRGDYVRAVGGTLGGHLTNDDMKAMIAHEEAAQEQALVSGNTREFPDASIVRKRNAAIRPALKDDISLEQEKVIETQEKLIEYARVANLEKARELVHASQEHLARIINGKDQFGWTALHWLSEGDADGAENRVISDRKLDMLKMLLDFKSVINVLSTSNKGNTALVHAIWNGNTRACSLFLKREPRLATIPTQGGWTALHWAVSGTKKRNAAPMPLPNIVQLLLKRAYNVNIDDTTQTGDCALHIACARGFDDIAKTMLLCGANVNTVNLKGQTPLHVAALEGRSSMIELLVSFHASLDVEDGNGRLPADVHALNIVHTLRLARCPNWQTRDEWEKKDLETQLAAWLSARGLSSSILSPSVDSYRILSVLSKRDLLQQQPDALQEEVANRILGMCRTLKTLLLGVDLEVGNMYRHGSAQLQDSARRTTSIPSVQMDSSLVRSGSDNPAKKRQPK